MCVCTLTFIVLGNVVFCFTSTRQNATCQIATCRNSWWIFRRMLKERSLSLYVGYPLTVSALIQPFRKSFLPSLQCCTVPIHCILQWLSFFFYLVCLFSFNWSSAHVQLFSVFQTERHFIMQVVCEATQCPDNRVSTFKRSLSTV